jgi:hypothetical protein
MLAGLANALLARKAKLDEGSSVISVGTGSSSADAGGSSAVGAAPLRPAHHGVYCGLLNQGATCYLNSLLQTLYCHEEFRAQVFASRCKYPVTRALQALFAEMQLGV